MVYLDNAATTSYKPKCVIDALLYDLAHSANSGRSAHNEAIKKDVEIAKCRSLIKKMLGADDEYEVIFTKSCTEALNLAIQGGIPDKSRVLTTSNEHNSVLRPLFMLQEKQQISLEIANSDEQGRLNCDQINSLASESDVLVCTSASNVTGEISELDTIGKIARKNHLLFILDGAQGVPVVDINMKELGIDMLACPAHKGLHGIQGVGFLVVKRDIPLKPLLHGGTGAQSSSVLPEAIMPEGFEAGTQFSGGICALMAGTKWSLDNLSQTRKHYVRISESLQYILKQLGATLYGNGRQVGIVSFNIAAADSTKIADMLNENEIYVRAGLHCAPLAHKRLGTIKQGAVRLSVGVETSDKDVAIFASTLERIVKRL